MHILLVLKQTLELTDASDKEQRSVAVPAGWHEVERINNPYGCEDDPWLVLKGTKTGISEAFLRRWSDPKVGDLQTVIKELSDEEFAALPVAISGKDAQRFGCPYCGYRSGHSPISGMGTSITVCGECDRSFAILAEGVTQSTIGFGDYYPKLQAHPRQGIPSHGKSDKRPEGGGEFFHSRGIGLDNVPCFMCPGSETTLRDNIAAFVQCKAAGERVVEMFRKIAGGGARLDYRNHEPDRVQVKVGACKKHRPNLDRLNELVGESDGILTENILREVTGVANKKKLLILSHDGLLRALCRNEVTFADLETALFYLDYDGSSSDLNYTARRVLGSGNAGVAIHALTNKAIQKATTEGRFIAQPSNACDLHKVGYGAVSDLLQRNGCQVTLPSGDSRFGYHPGLVASYVNSVNLPLAVIQ